MKTSITYTLACLVLEAGAILAALMIYQGPYDDTERIAAVLAPGVQALALWGAWSLVAQLRRLRVEAQIRHAERAELPSSIAKRRLRAIEAELRAAKRAYRRAWWSSAGISNSNTKASHELDMLHRVQRLEAERLNAIREMHE